MEHRVRFLANGDVLNAVLHVALVVVIMPIKNHVRPIFIQGIPQRAHTPGIIMPSGGEARLMEHCQRAGGRVGCKVEPQPPLLLRAGCHFNVAVQHDDMPRTQIERIVALAITGAQKIKARGVGTKIGVMPLCPSSLIFVVAHHGCRAVLEASPGWIIAIIELLRSPLVIGIISQREDRTWDILNQLGRRISAFVVTVHDIARAHQHGVALLARLRPGRNPFPKSQAAHQ